jgi:hypothetical protein
LAAVSAAAGAICAEAPNISVAATIAVLINVLIETTPFKPPSGARLAPDPGGMNGKQARYAGLFRLQRMPAGATNGGGANDAAIPNDVGDAIHDASHDDGPSALRW